MISYNKRIRETLFTFWKYSFKKITRIDVAPPVSMPIDIESREVLRYIVSAVRLSAPKSTLCMVLFTFLGAVFSIAQSMALGQIVGAAEEGNREAALWQMALLLGLWLITPLFQVFQSLARLFSSQNLRVAVVDHLTARLMHSSTCTIVKKPLGNLVERIELASASLPEVVCVLSDTVVKILSVALLASVVLASVSAQLAVIAAIWMFSALLLSSHLAATGIEIVENASDAHSTVMAKLTELVVNIPLIQSFAAQVHEREHLKKSLDNDLNACRKARSYWIFVQSIETLYKWLFTTLTMGVAVNLFINQELSLSQLITAFSVVIALTWHFETVAFHFVDLFDSAGTLKASLRELSEITFCKTHSQPGPKMLNSGSLKVSNLHFSYDNKPALTDISLYIKPGAKIGLAGASGSGKSTLLSLIRGELIPEKGTVEMHGISLADASPQWFSNTYSEATHSALMFNRSIQENINYNNISVNPDHLEKAVIHSQSTFIEKLPLGIHTIIEERGANLSTGERQRLSIARALLKPTPLLILDEATSSLDSASEERIIRHIVDNLPSTTVLMVTHRVSTLAYFDEIILLQNGAIIDRGPHLDLLKRNSFYRRLQNSAESPRC